MAEKEVKSATPKFEVFPEKWDMESIIGELEPHPTSNRSLITCRTCHHSLPICFCDVPSSCVFGL